MWLLKINAPDKEAQQLQLKPGTLTVGKLSTNEIVIEVACLRAATPR